MKAHSYNHTHLLTYPWLALETAWNAAPYGGLWSEIMSGTCKITSCVDPAQLPPSAYVWVVHQA